MSSRRINKVPRNPSSLVKIEFEAIPFVGVKPLTSQFSVEATSKKLVWQKVPSNPVAGLYYQKRQG